MKIGVISDTHNFFDPKVPELFSGVDHILHGGDIGSPSIVIRLEEIAPVTAVLGNTDDPGLHFRQTETVALDGITFLVHHIVNPRALEEALQDRIEREKAAVVVFGHTHRPFSEVIDGVRFLNPGYAGRTRFGMERTLAILHCEGADQRRVEYISLDQG